MNIIECLEDKRLLGGLPAFQDLHSWSAWLVFLKAVYGLPMTSEEEATFRHHTGRSIYDPPNGGYKEAVLIVGRQSGKSFIAAAITVFEAITAPQRLDGTDLYAALVAQDARAALRTLLSYARAPFDVLPILRQEVETDTAESIRLKSGLVLAAYPCRPAAVRGIRARVVCCDELAFFQSTENLPQDREMLRALRPTLAMTGGRLVVLSSPYGSSGALWDLHRQHFGKNGSPVLVWQATAPEMNPLLPADYLERMATDDPEAYCSEVLGEFRSGLTTFLDPQAIQDCVAAGVRERWYVPGTVHKSGCDSSGGRNDRFAVTITHEENGVAIVDAIRVWLPPFNPAVVIREAAELLKRYGIHETMGDHYGAEFTVSMFNANGITYEPCDLNRSELFLEFLPKINSRQVVLLDHPELLKELRGLERKRGTNGRDRVDHRPGQGNHDDIAVSVATAVYAALKQQCVPGIFVL